MDIEGKPRPPGEEGAYLFMAMDLLSYALQNADEPREVARQVTKELRSISGARVAVLLQCLDDAGVAEHRVLAVFPERRQELARSTAVTRLGAFVDGLRRPTLWTKDSVADEVESHLGPVCGECSVAALLRVGEKSVGSLLLLDVPKEEPGTPLVLEALEMLSTTLALVLHHSLLYEQQEQIIAQRTRELTLAVANLQVKNTELEQFTYSVSHDLRSPLITIKGFLGALEEDLADNDLQQVHADIESIRTAAETMERLLGDLLELSRVGRLVQPPERISLADLARETVTLLTATITEHDVTVEIAPDLPVVVGDRSRLLQVLLNLIENAVKFMGDQSDPRVEVGCRRDETLPVCFVRDNGIGIAPAYHERVFGLFQRLDPTLEGTGIGLALVKRIVEVHGGRSWVESTGNRRGSTFCFTLPWEPNAPADEPGLGPGQK